MENKYTVKEEILLAMYRSVDRMNDHYRKGNDHGICSEQWLQVNLRNNFEAITIESQRLI